MEHTNFQRRSFLKKAVYVAPVVMAMGTLTAPASAQAGSKIWTGTVNGKSSPITVTTTPTTVKINKVVIPKTGSKLSKFASFIK